MRFGIIGRIIREEDIEVIQKLFKWMDREGIKFIVENSLIEKLGNNEFLDKGVESNELVKRSDMILALGGDGGILSTAKIVGREMVPILGVNTGRLGFLAEIDIQELIDNIKILSEKKFTDVKYQVKVVDDIFVDKKTGKFKLIITNVS